MRSRTKKLVVAASATALLFAGTTPGHAANAGELANHQTPAAATQATFTGEDLFTGLLLGYGPVADQHPDLITAEAVTGEPQELAEFITQLTDTIDQLDPTFFDTFAADITSGNPVHVDRAVRAGGEILHTVLTDHFDASAQQTIDDETGVCVAAISAAVVVTVATLTVVINVNAVANINVVVHVNSVLVRDHTEPEIDGLGYEKWINQVAKTLV